MTDPNNPTGYDQVSNGVTNPDAGSVPDQVAARPVDQIPNTPAAPRPHLLQSQALRPHRRLPLRINLSYNTPQRITPPRHQHTLACLTVFSKH